MRAVKISLILILIGLVSFCSSKKIMTSQKITKDGLEILYGEISKKQLFYDFPEWQKNYRIYKVNHTVLDSISIEDNGMYNVDIFLGTWCGDSKREVPRFLRILDETTLVLSKNVKIYAVDRKKKLNNGLAEQNNIQRVATFIISKESKEIGRIVESPENNLESDLVKILKNH